MAQLKATGVTGSLIVSGSDATINNITVGRGGGSQVLNTAIGVGALAINSTGFDNVAIGNRALSSSTGNHNVAIGSRALENGTPVSSVAVGSFSQNAGGGGGENTSVGAFSLQNLNAGVGNVAIGRSAAVNLSGTSANTSNNTFMGYFAAPSLVTGSNNIFLGNSAGGTTLTSGSNNILIGRLAGSGSTSLNDTFILRLGDNERARINSVGNLGIATASPSAGLHVDASKGILSAGVTHNYNIRAIGLQGAPCEGTNAGYLILGKKHPNPFASTFVNPSYVIGKAYVRRGAAGSGHRIDVYEIISSIGYNGESFYVNCTTPAGQSSFFVRTVSCTYGGTAYHALEFTQSGGGPQSEITFEGVAVDSPLILTDASFVSSVAAFGQFGIMQAAGNVGIGTASPSQKLHVSGGIVLIDGGGDLQIRPTTPGGNGIIRFLDTAGTNRSNLYFAGTDLFRISDLTADRLVINSAGNVGIGTNSPQQALDVVGSMRLSTGNIYRPDNAGLALQLGNSSNSHFGTHLFFNGIGNTERVRITDGGNVGIGTTSPNTSLSVKGAGTGIVDIGQWNGSSNYGAIYLNGDFSLTNNYNILSAGTDKELYLNRPTGNAIRFRMNNADQMVLENNGRLGIGTTGPATLLHVSGNSGLSIDTINAQWANIGANVAAANYMQLRRPGSANALGYIGGGAGGAISAGTSNDLAIRSEGDLHLATGNSPRLTIDSAGDVGIGTTNPTSTLSVGSTSQFQVNSTGNLVRINNVAYSWPTGQATTADQFLANDGSGGLTWKKPGSFNNVTITATSITLDSTNDVIIVTAASAVTITLPLASAAGITGKIYNIKRTSTGVVTVATTGTNQLDGVTSGTYPLNTANQSVTVVSSGTAWFIL